MMAREFLRRRVTLILLITVPLVSYVAVYAALPHSPATVDGFENGVSVQLDLDQRDVFGVFQGLQGVGFLAGIVGVNLMLSGLRADRRLILAGYSAAQLTLARIALLVAIDAAITAYMVSVMLFFTLPRQLPAYALALFWAALIYSMYGMLTGVLVRHEWGGILIMLFLPSIDAGYLQVPGFSNILDEWWARLLPAYFPAQLAVDAAFTAHLEQLGPSFWSFGQSLVVAGLMLLAYQRATHVHPFLPEKPAHTAIRRVVIATAAVVVGVGGGLGYVYYRAQPPVVEADGRLHAPDARIVSPSTGRIRSLTIREGDDVVEDQMVGWVEDLTLAETVPVRAPLSGRITRRPVREGENVVYGDVLAHVHQLDRLEAVLEVEETDIAHVRVGQRVELRFGSLAETREGYVSEIAYEPMPPEQGVSERVRRVRKYAVKAALFEPDPRLRIDMAVRGRIYR
jgi:biotin carboxyl carrier protein